MHLTKEYTIFIFLQSKWTMYLVILLFQEDFIITTIVLHKLLL